MDRREADDVRRLLRALGYGGAALVPPDRDTLTSARRLVVASRFAGSTQVPAVPTWPPPLVGSAVLEALKREGWPDNYPEDWSNT